MACDISIKNSRLFKSPLSISDIIGKENWVFGTSDDSGRMEEGKNDGSGPLVIYNPSSIGRGIQVLNIGNRKEIQLSLPLPATEDDVRMLFSTAERIASLWKAKNMIVDEEEVMISDTAVHIERCLNANAGLFDTLKNELLSEYITLFCAVLPICVNKEDLAGFAADYKSFGQFLHKRQRIDAYLSVALFGEFADEICSHYIIFNGGEIILPKVPDMKCIVNGEESVCSKAYVIISGLFPEEKTSRMDYNAFLEKVPADKKSEFDCHNLVIRSLSLKKLREIFSRRTLSVTIPEESFALVESMDSEGAKALMVVNASLNEHKDDAALRKVFGYYCSVIFEYEDIDESLWPTSEEFSVMHDYVETFDKALKGDTEHPNALFVARVTQKGTCQMIWMLNNPDMAIEYMDGLISRNDQTRDFEYHIEQDTGWEEISWFLQEFKKDETPEGRE